MSDSQIDNLLEWNCSTIFLLYPLGLNRLILNKFGFKQAYLKDEYNKKEYKNPVFLLFEPEVSNFQMFVEDEYERKNPFTKTNDLIEDYDRGNGQVVLVYEFPDQFSEDYQKFLNGQYSRFSKEITNTYPKIVHLGRGVKILGSQYRIITKDRESENILSKEYGESFLITERIQTMAEMLEDRFGTHFTPDMELWQKPNMNKEILKYEYREITNV